MENTSINLDAQKATPFDIIQSPGMYFYSKDVLNAIGINDEKKISVCFGVTRIMVLPANCKLYNAPHLVCWNNNNSEVCFFVQYDDCDCLCTIRRHLDTADIWNLHGIPTEILLEPSKYYPESLFIIPVVNGVPVHRGPFYNDDYEFVPCQITGLKRVSEPKPQPPIDYIDLAIQSQSNHIPDPQRKANNRMAIFSIAVISISWIVAVVLLALNGNDRAATVIGTTGGLGILFAAIGRLAIHYKPKTSAKSMRWRIFAFFLLVCSTLTYQIARGVYALWCTIFQSSSSIGILFLVESLLLIAIPLVYSRKSMQLDENRFHNILAWLRMLSVALWIGCAIFAFRIVKMM